MNVFTGFIADYYDDLFSVSEDEYTFYKSFLAKNNHKHGCFSGVQQGRENGSLDTCSLEIGSGTGQLLIGYAREGFAVDGVDSSLPMVEQCTQKALNQGLNVTIYQQSMDSLDLPGRYHTIYLPSCIIQMAHNEATLRRVIRGVSRHLVPGGRVVISMLWPRNGILQKEARDADSREHTMCQHTSCDHSACEHRAGDPYRVLSKHDTVIEVYRSMGIKDDCVSCTYRFYSYKGGALHQQVTQRLQWRLYSPRMISNMLTEESLISHTWYKDYQRKAFDLDSCTQSVDGPRETVLLVVAQKALVE